MTQAITTQPEALTDPADAHRMTSDWRRFLKQDVSTTEEKNEIKAVIEKITVPAEGAWIAGRVSTLLDHYFSAPFPAPAMRAVADDWIEVLGHLPPWAIQA